MNEEWARGVLADPRTVVLDTETTGLDGYVCEIAVLDAKGEFLLNTLVDPQAPIAPGAQRVHGLSSEKLSGQPVFGDIWPQLEKIIKEHRVIVYNADFDESVIRREISRLAVTRPAFVFEDAMGRYSDWYNDEEDSRWVRLNGGHRAGSDCEAVYARLREMTGE